MLRLTPRKRQTLLFSATMTEEVRDLAALSLQRPVRLAADAAGAAPKTLQQEIIKLKVPVSPRLHHPVTTRRSATAQRQEHGLTPVPRASVQEMLSRMACSPSGRARAWKLTVIKYVSPAASMLSCHQSAGVGACKDFMISHVSHMCVLVMQGASGVAVKEGTLLSLCSKSFRYAVPLQFSVYALSHQVCPAKPM